MGFGVSQFIALSDTPADYADQAMKLVRVKSSEDGLEFGEVSLPAELADEHHRVHYAVDQLLENWTPGVTGSGSTAYANNRLTVSTGAVAGSRAYRQCQIPYGDYTLNRVRFASDIIVQFEGAFDDGGIAGNRRAQAFFTTGWNDTDLNQKGFGVRYTRTNYLLQGQSHDGTTLATVALGALPQNWLGNREFTIIRMALRHLPTARVEFYVLDGSLLVKKGEITTNLPTGDLSASFFYGVYNMAQALSIIARINKLTMYFSV